MDRELKKEILSQTIDHIITGFDSNSGHLSAHPAIQGELEPLLALAEKLRRHFVTFTSEPSPVFQESLRRKLIAAATEMALEQAHQRRFPFDTSNRRGLLVGAAALGSLVSVAVILVTSRAKSSGQSRTAA